jgi:hypothetical protein
MKKLFATVLIVLAMVFSTSIVMAEEEMEQKNEGWKPAVEFNVGFHNGWLDETSGQLLYNKPVSTQAVTAGIEKSGTGFYFSAENFAPFGREEPKATNIYLGSFFEILGAKADIGLAYYKVREEDGDKEYAIYAGVDFPEIFWQIVPFIKAEYRFAGNVYEEDEEGNIQRTSLDGFLCYVGLKREFKINERISLLTELGAGGNPGIYGMPAENLAFAREKAELVIGLSKQWKLNLSAMTQQNTGKAEGIAADTDKLFVGISLAWTF